MTEFGVGGARTQRCLPCAQRQKYLSTNPEPVLQATEQYNLELIAQKRAEIFNQTQDKEKQLPDASFKSVSENSNGSKKSKVSVKEIIVILFQFIFNIYSLRKSQNSKRISMS